MLVYQMVVKNLELALGTLETMARWLPNEQYEPRRKCLSDWIVYIALPKT